MHSASSQSCGGDPGEDHQAGQTKCGFSVSPRKVRQGEDCRLEVGPRQDPSRLQRTFHRFRVATADSALQTELAINIHTTVSDTRVMVFDIHRTIVRGQETSGGEHTSVSDTRTPVVT